MLNNWPQLSALSTCLPALLPFVPGVCGTVTVTVVSCLFLVAFLSDICSCLQTQSSHDRRSSRLQVLKPSELHVSIIVNRHWQLQRHVCIVCKATYAHECNIVECNILQCCINSFQANSKSDQADFARSVQQKTWSGQLVRLTRQTEVTEIANFSSSIAQCDTL